eukprot:scaffold22589_cov138-Cylindrotheca_fusiformis.AAC.38
METATKDELYYTSAQSDHAWQGLYKCSLERDTGLCRDPELLANRWSHDGETYRGLRLINVSLNDSKSLVYSVYFDSTRRGFEILRASLLRPVKFQSFFRTKGAYSNNDCGEECCAGAGHTYLNTKPRSYLIDGDDIFISWGGIYQDCRAESLRKSELKWTIGVSKLEQRPDCVLTGTQVDFADCTTPVALAYQGEEDIFLGYSSFQSSHSPSGDRIFFLSVLMDDQDQSESGLVNEIWAIPESGVFTKNPIAPQKISQAPVSRSFMYHSVDNVGSIRLRFDRNGIATALCTTAYDAGIFCSAFRIGSDSRVEVSRTEVFVTSNHIKDWCSIKASAHYPLSESVPALASGLEVVWNSNSSDHIPAMLFFGCLGEVPEQGNFVTAFRNGSFVKTLDGGFPGSIVFGKTISDSIPTNDVDDFIESPRMPATSGGAIVSSTILLFFGASFTITFYYYRRKISRRQKEADLFNWLRSRRSHHTYQDSIQYSDPLGVASATAYTELPSFPPRLLVVDHSELTGSRQDHEISGVAVYNEATEVDHVYASGTRTVSFRAIAEGEAYPKNPKASSSK